MSFLVPFVTNLLNKIIVGSIAGIGLIVGVNPGVNQSTPAIVIQNGVGNGSQRVWQTNFSGSTAQSGSHVVEKDLYVNRLPNCDTIDTTSSGKLVCGSDAAGAGASFGTGNVVTIVGGIALTSSTGALKTAFGPQFVQSSTGSLKLHFDGLYLRTSTGSLKTNFGLQFLHSSTGALANAYKNIFLASSTGTLATAYKNVFLASSTGALKANFALQFLQSSTGSLTALYNSLYFRSSTGSLRSSFDARYVNTGGDTMTGALNVRAAMSGFSLIVSGLNAANCDLKGTNGVISCGTDATGGAGHFGTGNTITIIYGTALTSSTGSLKTNFGLQFLQSSTGALANKFKNIFLASSTGSLETYFDTQYQSPLAFGEGLKNTSGLVTRIATLTGTSLEVYGTASGRTVHGQDGLRSSGSLVVESSVTLAGVPSCTALQSSSLGALSCNNSVYLQSSTGSLANAFKNVFLASSTGTLANSYKNIFLASSTGSLINAFDNIFLTSSTGSLKTLFDASYFRTSTGSLRLAFDNRYVNTLGDTMTGSLKVRGNMSGWTLYAGAMSGAGLTDCDGATQTLNWDAASLRFSCGTDSEGSGAFSQDSTDLRYVKKQGDTMTGALAILVAGGDGNTVAVEFPHTGSGRHLHAQDLLTSSGGLVVEGTVTAGDFVCSPAGCVGANELGTDSVNTDEIAANAVQSSEINVDAVTAAKIANNVVDYAEFEPTMDLDTDTEINLSTFNLSYDLDSTGDFKILNEGATVFIVEDDGSIGVGAGGFYEHPLHFNISDVGDPSDPRAIVVFEKNDDAIIALRPATTKTGAIIFGNSASDGQIKYDLSTDSFKLLTAGTQAMTIDSSQNVGIGTASPGNKLEVAGTMSGRLVAGGKRTIVWHVAGTLTTGTTRSLTYRTDEQMRCQDVAMEVETAPTGASLIVDINEAGTTIFSTRPEIDASATSEDNNHVLNDTVLASDAKITMDIDQIGSGTAGADLTVMLRCFSSP